VSKDRKSYAGFLAETGTGRRCLTILISIGQENANLKKRRSNE
jgi:hypothetical protein